MILQAV